ncbi:MAG: hypothetical protein HKN47_03255 [Pirellulaceae bacterium]|nr:hypothetical protein [Pirellulaceae bacterium]
MTRFYMGSGPADTAVIEQIAQWPHLRYAHLNCCNPRTDFDLRPLVTLTELEELEFYCTPFGDEGLETLGEIQSLRMLKLSAAHQVQGNGLKYLRDLKNLTTLEIQSRANWDAHFDDLRSLTQVKELLLIDVRLSEDHVKQLESIDRWNRVVWK